MTPRPKSLSGQSDSALDAEETLSIDHARWSGFRDGVGERENGVDEQGFSIELLRLRKEFNPFALALTDRILRLIDFDRPGASRALRVDQDENSPRLLLVSERAPGFRLSELLDRAAEHGVIPDLGAALYIMRRLLKTAAGIQRTTGIAHLAIAPERVLITPRGSVVIVEAAMAGAIESFGEKMPAPVRKALRLPRLEHTVAGAQVDVARITIAGMAMIVGRPIDPGEDIDPLSPVVQEVVDVAAVRAGDQFAAALTPWLDRAISDDPSLAFGDFADAAHDLDEIIPPAEARSPISRAPLRKFLADLAISNAHLESSEQERLREIRARQIRRVAEPAQSDAILAAPTLDAAEDPVAAIMDMPVAVEDLSSEILKQPLVIDDKPSAMAAVIKRSAAPFVDDGETREPEDAPHDFFATAGENVETLGELILPGVPDDAPGEPVEYSNEPVQSASEPVESSSELVESSSEPVEAWNEFVDTSSELVDISYEPVETSGEWNGVQAGPAEMPDGLADTPEEHVFVETPDEASVEFTADVPVYEPFITRGIELSPHDQELVTPTSNYTLEPTLDDLVDEILRRGIEPDLPDISSDETVDDVPREHVEAGESVGGINQYGTSSVFEAPPEPEVDEPPADEPPVDEPAKEDPPAEEPPPYDPPVQDPPSDDEPPGEEPPPIWLRAAMEQVARARQDRPTAPPPVRRTESRGPVFDLPDEPERELQPETTTLSDIVQEIGLTIPSGGIKPAIREEVSPQDDAPPAEQAFDEEAGWEPDIRRQLFGAEQEPAPPPPQPPPIFTPAAPVFTPAPPVFASPAPKPVFVPSPPPPPMVVPSPPPTVEPPVARSPQLSFEPSSIESAARSAPVVPDVPASAPHRSIAERAEGLRESGGRFVRVAATLMLVVGGLGAAAYGGWRYYSSISQPGTLVIESTPPGAQVEVDGIQRGTTPLTLEVPPGSHSVALTRRGMTRKFDVAVRSGEETNQSLDWTNVKETGSLAVSTDPVGAKVSVDGKAYGVTPLTIPDLPAGRRRVVLEGQGGTVRREVTIEADQTATLSEAIFSGFLAVFAPVELQIFEGSRLLGTTENSRIMIPAGRHELTLVNRDLGTRMTRTVEVEPGEVAAINITEVPATPQPAASPAPSPQN